MSRSLPQALQELYLPCISVKLVRCFKIERQIAQRRVVYYPAYRFDAERALAYFFVPVLVRLERIFAVVKMYCLKAVKTYYPVEFA